MRITDVRNFRTRGKSITTTEAMPQPCRWGGDQIVAVNIGVDRGAAR
jgi:hypothetical protein